MKNRGGQDFLYRLKVWNRNPLTKVKKFKAKEKRKSKLKIVLKNAKYTKIEEDKFSFNILKIST